MPSLPRASLMNIKPAPAWKSLDDDDSDLDSILMNIHDQNHIQTLRQDPDKSIHYLTMNKWRWTEEPTDSLGTASSLWSIN